VLLLLRQSSKCGLVLRCSGKNRPYEDGSLHYCQAIKKLSRRVSSSMRCSSGQGRTPCKGTGISVGEGCGASLPIICILLNLIATDLSSAGFVPMVIGNSFKVKRCDCGGFIRIFPAHQGSNDSVFVSSTASNCRLMVLLRMIICACRLKSLPGCLSLVLAFSTEMFLLCKGIPTLSPSFEPCNRSRLRAIKDLGCSLILTCSRPSHSTFVTIC
jgi:hypothetical protein